MPLNWSVRNCRDWEALVENQTLPTGEVVHSLESAKTEALVFGLMAIGIGEITVRNAAKVFARMYTWENEHGAWVHLDGEAMPFTPEDIERRIGLSTNVANENHKWFIGRFPKDKAAQREMDYRVGEATYTASVASV